MISKRITLLFFFSGFLPGLLPGNVYAEDFHQLSESLFDVYETREDALLLNENISIKSCETFPYYRSINTPTSGNHILASGLKEALKTVHQCSMDQRFHPFVNGELSKLYRVLTSEDEKVFTCNYGVTHSYFAVATDPHTEEQREHLPKHPGIIFDTNRMAGNFRVHMDEEDIENTLRFYGGRLSREEIIPGMPHPFRKKISNPTSLTFHEMFHWTGLSHHPKKYLDMVYLSQFCCFPQDELSWEQRERACALLKDERAWQKEEKPRLHYLKEHELQKEVKDLINAYHQ